MDKETRLEAKLRTLELESYNKEKARIDKAELELIKLFNRSYEIIDGIRRPLTKRRRIKLANDLIDKLFEKDIEVSNDAQSQLRAIDKDATS